MTSDQVDAMLAKQREVQGHAASKKINFSEAARDLLRQAGFQPALLMEALLTASGCSEVAPGRWQLSVELDDETYIVHVTEAAWGAASYVVDFRKYTP